jgi:hypothetical protein
MRCWFCSILVLTGALTGWAASPPKPAPQKAQKSVQTSRASARTADTVASSTSFEGTVLSVRREAFPEAVLALDVTHVGRPSVMQGRGDPHHLIVQARAYRSKGKPVSFSATRNVSVAGAYYLLAGDRVRGRMSYGEEGWTLSSVGRVPPPKAPKMASLQVELSTDHETYNPGEDIQLTLTITNSGSAPAVFNFLTGQRYDFAARQDDREVWRWSKNRAFTQALSSVTVGVGETLRFREAWTGVDNANQPVPPGTYTVVGWVTAQGQAAITESTADIEIAETEPSGPTVDDILVSPRLYLNKEITLEGLYRAHLAERGEPLVEGGPPTSRNDWILQDSTGSIYVAGTGGITFNSTADLNQRVKVHGLVRMNPEGRLYLRAWAVERLPTSRRR